MLNARWLIAATAMAVCNGGAVLAQSGAGQTPPDYATLLEQIETERQSIAAQQQALENQRVRLDELEGRLAATLGEDSAAPPAPQVAQRDASAADDGQQPAVQVGAPPTEEVEPANVAVLGDQGGIISRAGRVLIEPTLEYGRTDRNRFVFRGIEVPQSVLVGVFDINESRQDILTASLVGRFGVTSRLELSGRLPWVYRSDTAVLVPLVQNPPQSGAGTVNTSANGSGIGDVEFQARYQLADAKNGWPYLIGGVQVIAPTGSSPFELDRDPLGNATESATGSGFWAVSPSITALFPSDPATLFAVLGYTYNLPGKVDFRSGDVQIDRVAPGGAPNATFGLGIALNERTSASFGYAHTWQFGTESTVRPISVNNGIETVGDPVDLKARDLQIGRLLFGISHRLTEKTTIDLLTEIGATGDAADVRTTLRIPFAIK